MLKKTDLRYILNLAEHATLKKRYRIAKKIAKYAEVINICNTLNHDLNHSKIFYELSVRKSFPYTKYDIYITFYDEQKYYNHYKYINEKYNNQHADSLPLKIILEDIIQSYYEAATLVHNYSLVVEDATSVHYEKYTEFVQDQKVEFFRVFMY